MALSAGRACFEGSFRVVNAESDFLPGLIIDKYEGQTVIQLVTAGMERQKGPIVAAVKSRSSRRRRSFRNDSPSRTEEGLPCYTEVAWGA